METLQVLKCERRAICQRRLPEIQRPRLALRMLVEPSDELLSRWRACVADLVRALLTRCSEQLDLARAARFVDDLPFVLQHISPTERARSSEAAHADVLVRASDAPLVAGLDTIVGLDISFVGDGERAVAVLAVLSFPELEVLSTTSRRITLDQPYKPGFLAFREAPVLIDMLRELERPPQLVVIDGNGRWHPAQAGLAVAVGVGTGLPTIGIAKEFMPLMTDGGSGVWPSWADSQKRVHRVVNDVVHRCGDHVLLGRTGDDDAHAAVRDDAPG